ncbi:MAG: oligosaccharide flippase family protein [Bacteroidota bacterium]|nr:oligosaccharide flippase family protein [Bacteroidota bacterium]
MEHRNPRHFIKDLLYYGLGNMLYSLVQFFSMPILVKSMEKSEVANWNILLPTGVLLAAIVTFGMDSAVVRFVKDAQTEKEKKTIFSTGFFFEIGLAVMLALSMWFFAGTFVSAIKLSPDYTSSWWVLAIWLPGVIIAQYFQNWFKYTFRRSLFLSLIILQSAVYLAGILLMKFTDHVNLFNVILAMVASQFAVGIIGFFYCRGLFTFSINKKLLGQLLLYGLPFMVLSFGYNFIASIDRYMLAGKISDADFAIYTQAFRISAIISMLVSSFNFAFGPFLLSILGQAHAPDIISRFHTYYLMVMCFAGLCFMALAKIIIHILAGYDYIDGQQFMVLFVTGYIFYGMYSFAQAGIIHSRKSYLGLYTLLAGLSVVFLVDFLTVKKYMGYGTGAGFMLGNIIMVVLAGLFSAKYVAVRYNFLKDATLLILLFGGGLLLSTFSLSPNIYIDGGIKLGAVIFLVGSLLFILLSGTDKLYIRNFLTGKKITAT